MMLTKRNDPFAGLLDLHSQIDEMFNNFAGPMADENLPAMDLYTEDSKTVVAELQLPGYAKDEIEVSVHNGMLEIQGCKSSKEEKDKKREYMLRESHAKFYRSVSLPKTADTSKVAANFENGLLKITVPLKKLPEPTKIAVNVGGTKPKAKPKAAPKKK